MDQRIPSYASQIVLKLITDNDSFRNTWLVFAPDTYADTISYKSNSNCSCKNKIIKYVDDNKQSAVDFLDKWIGQNSNAINLDEFEKQMKPEFKPRIIEIGSSEVEYVNAINQLTTDRVIFRGLSVETIGNKRFIYLF